MSTLTRVLTGQRPESVRTDRRWNPARLAGGIALSAWAIMFWYLFLSGRSALYVSTRTQWVVPFGAILLTIAAAGRVVSARAVHVEPLNRRQTWVVGAMIIPVLLVLVLPPTALTGYAASRRSAFVQTGVTAPTGGVGTSQLSMLDVAWAQTTKQGAAALAKHAGESVTLLGFVTRYADTQPDEFLLTRLIITCCVADATIAQVRVVGVPPGKFASNDWVNVTGKIYPLGREVIVDQTSIQKVPTPSHPYITP